MSYLIAAITLAIVAAIEAAWPQWLYWGGERPEFLVAAVMSAGLLLGWSAGVKAAFFAAFYRGALEAQPWGGLFIAYLAIGLLAGTVGHRLLVRRASAAFAAALASVLVFRLLLMIFQPPGSLGLWFWGSLRACAYTAVFAVPLHAVLLSAMRRIQPDAQIWR